MFFKKINHSQKAGLTLIELLASIFIMMTIMAVVVYNHQDFTDNLEITNLAYAIALSIREAQVSGISVRSNPEASSGEEFKSAFGVHFNINDSNPQSNFPGNNKAFITFSDLSADEEYGNGSYPGFDCEDADNDECVKVTEIGRGNYISAICLRGAGINITCPPNIKSVDITFLRPKTDAITRFRNSGGSAQPSHDDKEAIICIQSPKGRQKTIHVLQTGQISVRQETCIVPIGDDDPPPPPDN